MRAALKTLHGFTESVIAERKKERSDQKEMEHEDEVGQLSFPVQYYKKSSLS